MPRLIDADEFIKKFDHVPLIQDAMRKAFDHMPIVEVVRCKDCRYRGSTAECLEHDADWFCADGEKREDETD